MAIGLIGWLFLPGNGADAPGPEVGTGTAEETPDVPLLEGRATGEKAAPTASKHRGHLAGLVVDEARRPLEGVELRAWVQVDPYIPGLAEARSFEDPAPEPDVLARARSGADGRFRLEGLAFTVRHWVEAIGEPPRHGARLVAKPQPGRDGNLVFVLGAGSALRGRVVDAQGGGVEAWVSAGLAFSSDGARHRNANWSNPGIKSAADGRFELPSVPNGTILLTATAPGFAQRRWIPIRTPAADEVTVRLAESDGAIVAGRISRMDESPVPNATVVVESRVENGGQLPEGTVGLALTDADGRYRIEGLLPGRIQEIKVVAEGYVASDFCLGQELRLQANTVLSFDVTLVRGMVVTGVVLDRDDRRVAGATVQFQPSTATHQPVYHLARSAVSGADGSFRLDGISFGGGSVSATQDVLASQTVTVAPSMKEGHAVQVRLVLQNVSTGSISGRVVFPDGPPASSATVTAYYARRQGDPAPRRWQVTAPCGPDGAFALTGLEPSSSWQVFATTSDAISAAAQVTLDDAGRAAPIKLELRRALRIDGRVVNAHGTPV